MKAEHVFGGIDLKELLHILVYTKSHSKSIVQYLGAFQLKFFYEKFTFKYIKTLIHAVFIVS